jgi:hypothetical protein
MRSSRRWGNKLAQINFAILAQDNQGAPIPQAKITATCADLYGADGVPPYYAERDANRDGLASFEIDDIIRAGPYDFQIQAFCGNRIGSISISVGIGNDTHTNPPFIVTLN